MPKKSKRKSSRATNRAVQDTTASRPTQAASAASKPFEFNPNYSHVIKDLRRIGALAGTFVVFLVVLSFILN